MKPTVPEAADWLQVTHSLSTMVINLYDVRRTTYVQGMTGYVVYDLFLVNTPICELLIGPVRYLKLVVYARPRIRIS